MSFIKGRVKLALVAVAALAALAGIGAAAAGFFITGFLFNYEPSGGSLSPYLVGYYDNREESDSLAENACDERSDHCVDDLSDDIDDVEAVVYLVNPTPLDLTAYIAVFDNEEEFQGCEILDLTPNDVTDFIISKYGSDTLGVVKVVTFHADFPGVKVQAGAKGWLTHYIEDNGVDLEGELAQTRESELQEVPRDVLTKDPWGKPSELDLIVKSCNEFVAVAGTPGEPDVED